MDLFIKLEKFLKENKLSGIFFIPKYGSATIFRNEVDKLVILDHAQLELDVEAEKRKNEISNRIMVASFKNQTESTPEYTK